MSIADLFSPFAVNNLVLPNRFVMAPMTRSFSPGGVPGADVAEYYRLRAAGGVGLIITEGATVAHAVAKNDPNVPSLHGDAALAGWKGVLDLVHREGGKMMAQVWHVGALRTPGAEPDPHLAPVSPSGLMKTGTKVGEPMSSKDIDDVIEAFGAAAETCRNIGFDGIEIHGAHGYLLDQFLWADTNLRTDGYGGDLVGRTRLVAEVIAESRRRTSPDFPIFLRLSQWKQQEYAARLARTPQELDMLLAPMVDAGVDAFDLSTRRYWIPEFEESDMNLAGWVKKLTGKPTMTVGSVGLTDDFLASLTTGVETSQVGIERLVAMFDRGDFDLVGIGRPLLSDPDWCTKMRDGRTDNIIPFDPAVLRQHLIASGHLSRARQALTASSAEEAQ